jgi:hypothetical protein
MPWVKVELEELRRRSWNFFLPKGYDEQFLRAGVFIHFSIERRQECRLRG